MHLCWLCIIKLCDYIELNHRSLYMYYTELQRKSKLAKGEKEKVELSETEKIILNIFLGNYVLVRLTCLFLKEACKPIIDFIDYFESRKIRVQDRFSKMRLLLVEHLGSFLKEGGIPDARNVNAETLLTVKYTDRELQLSNRNIVGGAVKKFLEEMKLKPENEELAPFFDSVREFYKESTYRMIQYFKTGLKSRTLEYLVVLSPSAQELPLEESRKMWDYLAVKFYNIISTGERDDLARELARYRVHEVKPAAGVEVDEWWSKMADEKVGEEPLFPVVSGFALGLATMCNGSSEAERDFSKQNLIFEDSKKCSTSQLLLQNKLSVMCAVDRRARDCDRCTEAIAAKKELEKTSANVVPYRPTHCHCSLLKPSGDLLTTCSDGKPYRRYKEANEEASALGAVMNEISADRRKADKDAEVVDLMKEVTRFRKKFQEEKFAKERERVDALKRLKVTVISGRKKETGKKRASESGQAKDNKSKQPKLFDFKKK